MNNFEKIKAMDIDEIAKYIEKIMPRTCEYCYFKYKMHSCDGGNNCRKYIKQWLESEE